MLTSLTLSQREALTPLDTKHTNRRHTMSTRDYTITLCSECAVWAANHDDSGTSSTWRDSADYSLLSHLAVDSDTEHEDDTMCDSCQSTLYGTRMEATDMWQVMAHEYGKRDAAASGLTADERAEVEPLSGEWAGDLVPLTLLTNVTGIPAADYADSDYAGTLDALCDAYEAGYCA